MTLTLDLPPDVEERLNQEAKRRGIAPARLALEALNTHLPPPKNGHTPPTEAPPLPEGSPMKTMNEHLRKRRAAGLEERPFYETATPEEWIQSMHEWAASHTDWPVLPPEADSRESMYEERTLRILGLERTEE